MLRFLTCFKHGIWYTVYGFDGVLKHYGTSFILGRRAGRRFLMRQSITAVNCLFEVSRSNKTFKQTENNSTKTSCVHRILSRWTPTSTCVLVIWYMQPQEIQATPYKRKPPPIVSVATSRQ